MNKSILCRIFVVSIIFLVSLSALAVHNVKAQTENTWTTLAPMQEKRWSLGVVEENGKIYAMGGYDGLSRPYLDINEEYDPSSDTWTIKASMPEPMSDFGITVYHGKIYCFNGETGSTYVYTPLYDTWEKKAPLPNPREGITANTLNDKIYIIGGNIPIMNVYNPSNDSWNAKTSLIASFSSYSEACSSVVFEGKIHAFGAVPLEYSHQIYDPITDSWNLGEPLIDGYYFSVACVTTGKNAPKQIYVFSADRSLWSIDSPKLSSQGYDPNTGNWSLVSEIPSGHLIGGATVLDDKVYVVGGAGAGYGSIHANILSRSYTPIGYGSPDPSYTLPPPTPTPTAPPELFPTILVIASVAVIAIVGLGIFATLVKRRSKPK